MVHYVLAQSSQRPERHSEKVAIDKPKRKASEITNPDDVLILVFEVPE